jgi:hypothetical protein
MRVMEQAVADRICREHGAVTAAWPGKPGVTLPPDSPMRAASSDPYGELEQRGVERREEGDHR